MIDQCYVVFLMSYVNESGTTAFLSLKSQLIAPLVSFYSHLESDVYCPHPLSLFFSLGSDLIRFRFYLISDNKMMKGCDPAYSVGSLLLDISTVCLLLKMKNNKN